MPTLCTAIEQNNAFAIEAVVMRLALLVDEADDPSLIGEAVRKQGGIDALVVLLDHPTPEVHQSALLVLGNLGASAVDQRADKTRAMLKAQGGYIKILMHLGSEYELTVAYALAAVQNTCSVDAETAIAMQEQGVVDLLEQFEQGGMDERITAYATGCLTNVRRTIAANRPLTRAEKMLTAVTGIDVRGVG